MELGFWTWLCLKIRNNKKGNSDVPFLFLECVSYGCVDQAYGFPVKTHIPMRMKRVPETYFISWGLKRLPRNFPKRTPKIPASARARTTASITVVMDFVCDDAARAAN
ncbi:hypothetical protein D3C87_410800 [compost metagenome]